MDYQQHTYIIIKLLGYIASAQDSVHEFQWIAYDALFVYHWLLVVAGYHYHHCLSNNQ